MPRSDSIDAVLQDLLVLLRARTASVWRPDAHDVWKVTNVKGPDAGLLRRSAVTRKDSPFIHRSFARGRPLLVEKPSAAAVRRISKSGANVMRRTGIQAFAAFPIRVEGKSAGVLAVSFQEPRRYSRAEKGYLQLVARQIGATLDARRLLAESVARERAMAAFAEVAALVAGSLELPTVLRRIADNAARVLDASHAFVFLAEHDGTLVGAAATGRWDRRLRGYRVPPSENSMAQWAFRDRRTVVVGDVRTDPHASPRLRRLFGTRAIVATPLMAERSALGVLAIVDTRTPREFDPEEVERVELLARYAAVAIGHAAIHEALREREAELRILSERLANAHESERRRISRELHDVVGQGLAALALELAAADRAARPPGSLPLAGARRLLRETADAARRLSAELHPGILDDLGLLPAVRWYCGAISERSGIPVSFHCTATAPIPPDAAVVLYRAVQEGLANVTRHANARNVAVRLVQNRDGVALEIEDDGKGISPRSSRQKRPGVGLLAIRERATALGGWAELVAGAKRGAILRVHVPRTLRRS